MALKYELEQLEMLIQNSKEKPVNNQKRKSTSTVESSVKRETERIKVALVREVFSLHQDKLIEIYIQHHQEAIIRLLDKIPLLPESSQPPKQWQLLSDSLEELLTFIEKHFSKYFNLNAKVPENYRLITAAEIQQILAHLERRLNGSYADPSLYTLSLNPLKCFVSQASHEEITFSKLIYLKELAKELMELNTHEENIDEQIYTLMGYLNFNSIKFFTHCTDRIFEYANVAETLHNRIERFAYLLKRTNQVQVKPGFALIQGYRSIKEQLVDWITEEIAFLEKRHQLSFSFAANIGSQPVQPLKLNTSLSVPQLAFFIKVLIDLEVIKTKNIQEVIRFVSSSFTSKRMESISPDSFKAKFYNTEQSAVEVVKDISIKMMNHINKTYKA